MPQTQLWGIFFWAAIALLSFVVCFTIFRINMIGELLPVIITMTRKKLNFPISLWVK